MCKQIELMVTTLSPFEKFEVSFELLGNGIVIVKREGCASVMADASADEDLLPDASNFDEWCSEWIREHYPIVLMVEHTVNLYE